MGQKFDWVYYCPACFRRYRSEDVGQRCRVFGPRLKRKVVRKEKVANKIGRS